MMSPTTGEQIWEVTGGHSGWQKPGWRASASRAGLGDTLLETVAFI